MKKGQIGFKREIQECRDFIYALESGFNEVNDDRLTDWFIYELKAAETRLNYLMKMEGEEESVARNT